MNLFILVWSYLKARPLNTAINIALLSLGIGVITVLLLLNTQLQNKITQNSRGIDLVIGAKGSPLQIILCNIFHIDFPTGNIKVSEAERICKSPLIKLAIPMALGDSYGSYRIIGTNRKYAELYNAEISDGKWWDKALEVTIGANVHTLTGLRINDEFVSAHGLSEGGHVHNDHKYVVRGIMKPTNSVIDNVILTNVESIWEMHEEQNNSNAVAVVDPDALPLRLIPSLTGADSLKEITSVLIQYRSALGAIQLPRLVNAQSSLQAASPAFESARLFSILGVGADILMAFAYVLIAIAGLSIFIALYNALKERRYDMAIMRSMGAGRSKLSIAVLLEGGILTLLGSVIGLLLGHGVMFGLSSLVEESRKAGITGFVFYTQEWILLTGSLFLGLLCALIPALQAYRTDISKVLAGN